MSSTPFSLPQDKQEEFRMIVQIDAVFHQLLSNLVKTIGQHSRTILYVCPFTVWSVEMIVILSGLRIYGLVLHHGQDSCK